MIDPSKFGLNPCNPCLRAGPFLSQLSRGYCRIHLLHADGLDITKVDLFLAQLTRYQLVFGMIALIQLIEIFSKGLESVLDDGLAVLI